MDQVIHGAELKSTWDYYFQDIWNYSTDPRVSELPLLNGDPWPLIVYMIFFLVLYSVVFRSMQNRKQGYFMKPFQIIYYGFFYGFHGIAFPVVLVLTSSPINFFRCNLNENVPSDLPSIMLAHAGFLYLAVKLVNHFDLLILLWTKNNLNLGNVMGTVLGPFIVYGAIKYYPGAIIAFPMAVDCLVNAIKYGLGPLACTNANDKPFDNWLKLIHYIKIGQYSLLTLHSIYTLTIQNCECLLGLRWFLAVSYFCLTLVYSFDIGYYSFKDKSPRMEKFNKIS